MLTEFFQVQRFSRTWEYILHRLASYKIDMNININIQIQIHDGYITLLVYVRRLVVKKTQTDLHRVKSHIRQISGRIVLLVQDLRLH